VVLGVCGLFFGGIGVLTSPLFLLNARRGPFGVRATFRCPHCGRSMLFWDLPGE
jgi:hypothetical protein